MTRRGSPPRRLRPLLRGIGALLGAVILGGSSRLVRLKRLHVERETRALADHGSVVYAFWHGRGWLIAGRAGRRGTAVLISLSEDGDVMARAASRLGFHPVRGSSSRGGRESLAEMARGLAEGRSAAITPDGPRGPRHHAQIGAVVLAARTGKPIVPMGIAARPAWTMKSWDAFQIPRPGGRAVVVYGEPIAVPAAEDLEPWRVELETALNAVEAEADREVMR
jgi:lysophospholipid acyltransferase (LPLAT)-like uncharacterized protein